PKIEANISFKDVDFDVLAPGQLWRFSVDLPTGSVDSKLIESRCCEFPYVHPNKAGREHRYIFLGAAHNPTGNAPLQAILKLDVETGDRSLHSFAPKGYVSEPIFVPKPNATSEDEGWVLTLVYDANHHRSDLVILDGQNLQGDAIATLHLKHHVPYGLHGNWTSECFL
ncbi:MAG: carotenoid oxygenase family protein, partial [Xenococcaceae cyanobacterium]